MNKVDCIIYKHIYIEILRKSHKVDYLYSLYKGIIFPINNIFFFNLLEYIICVKIILSQYVIHKFEILQREGQTSKN